MINLGDNPSRLAAVFVVHYGDNEGIAGNCQVWELVVQKGSSLCFIDNNPHESQLLWQNGSNQSDRWARVSSPSNPGYLGGVEAGLKTIIASGAEIRSTDFVIITNSDVENLTDCAAAIADVSSNKSIAVVGPTITPPPTWAPHDLSLMRSIIGAAIWGLRSLLPARLLARAVDLARSSTSEPKPLNKTGDQIMVHGACFAVRFDVLEQYFALRHRPWMYGEEVLLGRVLRRMGLSFAIDENWQVSHPPKTFSPQISRRLARARARSLWMITLDRITERSQRRRNSSMQC